MRIRKVVAILIIVLISFTTNVKAEDTNKGIILIDAGHGGIDGGAKSKNGTIEKDINLQISQKLRKRLEDEGYKVYMTRETDTELSKKKVQDLEARCKMKVETKCDVFISIHQNKFSKEYCFGAQVWYSDNEKSLTLANIVQESLKEKVQDKNKRVAKPAKNQYKILRDKYDGGCIIVECGFLSNHEEEQRLKSDKHQDEIINGLVLGISRYFESGK